jgi:hypothetical protein
MLISKPSVPLVPLYLLFLSHLGLDFASPTWDRLRVTHFGLDFESSNDFSARDVVKVSWP